MTPRGAVSATAQAAPYLRDQPWNVQYPGRSELQPPLDQYCHAYQELQPNAAGREKYYG